jgi:hypothetical protein
LAEYPVSAQADSAHFFPPWPSSVCACAGIICAIDWRASDASHSRLFLPPTGLYRVGPNGQMLRHRCNGLTKTAAMHPCILCLNEPISSGVSIPLLTTTCLQLPSLPNTSAAKTMVAQCLEGERRTRPPEESRLRPPIDHDVWLWGVGDPP